MFNTRYGLENAVLRGTKTRTWRADKKPRYEVGEIVAIKQSYKEVMSYTFYNDKNLYDKVCNLFDDAGATNKMFVKNELMPHQIRITKVTPCRLQDITDDECMKEGVESYMQGNNTYYNCRGIYMRGHPGVLNPFKTAKDCFFMLINKLNGWGYWNTNPNGYAYEFELIK